MRRGKKKSRDRERRKDAGLGWNTSTASACFTTAHRSKNIANAFNCLILITSKKKKRKEIITQPRLIMAMPEIKKEKQQSIPFNGVYNAVKCLHREDRKRE